MWLLVAVLVILLIYLLVIRPHKYWINKGVQQGTTGSVLSNTWTALLRLQPMSEIMDRLYKQAANYRYFGMYQFMSPMLMIRDPDLIKKITVKDFDHFVDHVSLIPEEGDPLWGKNLFALTGKKWRDMRSALSPAFTGSKMKFMFNLIRKNGEQFANFFLDQKKDLIVLEMKDTYSRFANDVIANAAFGFECDSLRERDNEFYLMGKSAFDLSSIWVSLKIIFYLSMPKIAKCFKVNLFSEKVRTFFTSIIKENIRSREEKGVVRTDMIQLLLEARKTGFEEHGVEGKKLDLTDEDIAAQAMVFFFAGFDSISGQMTFLSYELALNPDVQKRLIEEIDNVLESCKGTPTYEAIVGMKYMDMVINEALRKWPNAFAGDRTCTKPYTIEPEHPDEKPVHLKVGDTVILPFLSIQRDPEYFPNPELFDPERFSDENKKSIDSYTFLAFGIGPRVCIGSRFALLEMKILFFYLLSHFEIIPVEKTQIPVKICKKQFSLTAENGMWLGFKKRIKE